MNRLLLTIITGLGLLISSMLIYLVQVVVFDSPRDTIFYLFEDMAFMPIQILFVTLILNQFLTNKAKREKLKKINMVISTFFSEVGTDLLKLFSEFHINYEELQKELLIKPDWNEEKFKRIAKETDKENYVISSKSGDLDELKGFLISKKMFLLSLLENPNLLEHETFTDLLWAVFHIGDELIHRESLSDLPESDFEHLSIDIKRAYTIVIHEYLYFMKHLKSDYPYLFSIAVRKNPFNPDASVIVR